jgi:hypothetical protein
MAGPFIRRDRRAETHQPLAGNGGENSMPNITPTQHTP